MKKIYIEAGANDGIFQSRTLHLAQNDEYFGILIEPVYEMYLECLKNRNTNTKIYNCALVDFEYKNQDVPINLHNRFTAMCSIISHPSEEYPNTINVAARTLDSILEENNITHIDSFYLDVEGYEYNVLNGINFNIRHFNTLEIECHYNFLNISAEEEQCRHEKILNQYGYRLVDKNKQEGNIKLIFNHETI